MNAFLVKCSCIACGVLLATNIFSAYIAFSWRAEAKRLSHENAHTVTALTMEKQSGDELRKNVQAAIDYRELSGLYEWKNPIAERYDQLDLRSDGSGQYKPAYSNSKNVSWHRIDNGKISIQGHGQFRIENADLIDERGNRWLHIR